MNAKLKCKILAVKNPRTDMFFAHIQLGEIFADVPCMPDVVIGDASLVITFKDYQGRLQSSMKVVA